MKKEKEQVTGPTWWPEREETGRLTVGRKIALNLTLDRTSVHIVKKLHS
jgi:hypothetical protein